MPACALAEVESFAAAVTELAATDAAAAQISLRAARELALSVSTGLSRVADPEDSREGLVVGMVGGVFRSPVIRSLFEELMGESWPEVAIRVPQGTGLDGAATLPELADAHPLHAQIAVADAHLASAPGRPTSPSGGYTLIW